MMIFPSVCMYIGQISTYLIIFNAINLPGEVARLKSYITQRPPFDVKNPFMAEIKMNNNIHKVLQPIYKDY